MTIPLNAGLSLGMFFSESIEEQIDLAAEVGFQAVATDWDDDTPVQAWSSRIHDLGMQYDFLHAPFVGIDVLWEEGSEGDKYTDRLIRGLDACVEAQSPIFVCHAIIGMDKHTPNALGIKRFGRILKEARERHIILALENTEGPEYLAALMAEYRQHPACGFCWDTGHELCYNTAIDQTALYGDKLVMTHLNDNLGVTNPPEITWVDDAHMQLFDGIANWDAIAQKLRQYHYRAPLHTELISKNRPDRHTHDQYAHLSCKDFMALALTRAQKLAEMLN